MHQDVNADEPTKVLVIDHHPPDNTMAEPLAHRLGVAVDERLDATRDATQRRHGAGFARVNFRHRRFPSKATRRPPTKSLRRRLRPRTRRQLIPGTDSSWTVTSTPHSAPAEPASTLAEPFKPAEAADRRRCSAVKKAGQVGGVADSVAAAVVVEVGVDVQAGAIPLVGCVRPTSAGRRRSTTRRRDGGGPGRAAGRRRTVQSPAARTAGRRRSSRSKPAPWRSRMANTVSSIQLSWRNSTATRIQDGTHPRK